jgi:hypothetical protein
MLNKIAVNLYIVFLVLILVSCKSKEMATDKKEVDITFQPKVIKTESYNQDKSMILALNYTNDIHPIRNIAYQVLDSKSKKVLKEGNFTGMKLAWFTKNQLKGYLYVGMDKKESTSTLMNTSTNKKINKNILIIDIK